MKELSERQLWAMDKLKGLASELNSNNKACNQIGVSASTISAINSATYRGDVDKQLQKVIAYFENKEAAAEIYTGTEYKPTSISSDVYKIIKNCQLKGGLAIACGDAGIGKTQACKQYYREHSTNCIYVTANPCIKSSKAILKLIGSHVNVSANCVEELWLELVGKLSDGMIIIIDEAQHLSLKTIETLRSLADYFDSMGQTLGVCFVGNEITINRLGGKQKAEFAQIRNRTKQTRFYSTKNIVKSDIELLFPELKSDVVSVEFMLRIAQSAQAIRGATNLFANAIDNENITHKGLVAAAKFMDLAV